MEHVVRYFMGRSGTGKTHQIYQEIKALQEKKLGSKGFLIVPEQFTLQAEQTLAGQETSVVEAETALAGASGFGGITVTSFSRLIHQILEETGLPSGEKMDAVGKAMLVKKAFMESQKSLEVFSKVHERSGFIQMFTNFLSELKQGGVSPEALLAHQEGLSPTTVAKLKDTALIYGRCLDMMKGQFVDEEDLYALMATAVGESERLKGAHIWIDGFYFFNGLEHNILQAFAKQAASLTVALTFDPLEKDPDDIFWAPYDAFQTMHRNFEASGTKETKKYFGDTSHLIKEDILKHLESNLFHFPSQVYSLPSDSLKLVQCESPLQEVAWVSGEIRRLVLEEDVAYSDIVLIHHQSNVYEPIVKRVMSSQDIPVFINERRQLTHSPLVTYLRSMLELFQGSWKTEALMRALKSGVLGAEKESVDRLEVYAIERGLRGKKWHQPISADPDLEAIRLHIAGGFEAVEKSLKACKTVDEYTKCLWNHLESPEAGIKDHYERLVAEMAEREDYEAVNDLVQSWKGVVSVFDQLSVVSGDDSMTLKTYGELLNTAFSLKEIGVLPPSFDRVVMGSLDYFRSKTLPYVFFLGFNDGFVPSIQDGSGILADEEKVRLRTAGLPLKSDGELMAKNELFLIYQALTKANRCLYVSCSLSDTVGKPLRPSMYWERLKLIFPNQKPVYHTNASLQKSLADSHVNSLVGYTAEGLRRMVAGYPEDPFWIERFDYLAKNENIKLKDSALRIAQSLYHQNQPKPMNRTVAKKLYGDDIRASVTRLEAFNACPFSHFVRFGLKPKKQKIFELSLPDMGNLFHQSVEHFAVEALLKDPHQGRELSDEAIAGMMDRIVDQTVNNARYDVFRADARSAYMVNKLKRTGKRAAKLMLAHLKKGVFDPKAFEVAFGMEPDAIPPICIELNDGQRIYLEGRIDRVDVYDSGQGRYVKVIDYKSGFKKYHLGDVYNGLQIQLMVYMDAVLSAPEAFQLNDPIYPAGVFYFKIDDPLVEAENLSEADIEAAISKQLKMDGLVVGDRYVASFIDEELKEDGSKSEVIPFEVKKEGEPGRYASYLSNEHFEALRIHVRQGIQQVCEEMAGGQVAVSPYRCGTEIACDRCDYKGLCQFDLSLRDNAYRNLNRLERDDLIEKLEVASNAKVD